MSSQKYPSDTDLSSLPVASCDPGSHPSCDYCPSLYQYTQRTLSVISPVVASGLSSAPETPDSNIQFATYTVMPRHTTVTLQTANYKVLLLYDLQYDQLPHPLPVVLGANSQTSDRVTQNNSLPADHHPHVCTQHTSLPQQSSFPGLSQSCH